MSETHDEARNELERKLQAAIDGVLDSEDFMRELLDQQVFIPVRDEPDSGIANFQRSTKATPLVIQDEDGRNVLVLFTSPERAREFLVDVSGFSGGLLTEFSWILERMEPGFSITVNPGMDFGMDIEPDDVMRMIELLAEKVRKN